MHSSDFEIGPYDVCPCGSGKKYKFCCAEKAKAHRRGRFPIGTVALYGPDNKKTTKIAASVVLFENADPILERFVANDVLTNPKILEGIKKHFALHGVKSVVVTDGNLGCPHEEGIDFPRGGDCPQCPYWAGKQGSGRTDLEEYDDEIDDDDQLMDEDEFEDDDDELIDEADAEESEPKFWQERRDHLSTILGTDGNNHALAQEKFFIHLQRSLSLPCEVKSEYEFFWETPYSQGQWDQEKYAKLKEVRPSHADTFVLLSIDRNQESPWMGFAEDLSAKVRRVSDGKEFVLGLSELTPTDPDSSNAALLDDYTMWLDFRNILFPAKGPQSPDGESNSSAPNHEPPSRND